MNRAQAKEAISQGKKVKHESFKWNDYVCETDGIIIFHPSGEPLYDFDETYSAAEYLMGWIMITKEPSHSLLWKDLVGTKTAIRCFIENEYKEVFRILGFDADSEWGFRKAIIYPSNPR